MLLKTWNEYLQSKNFDFKNLSTTFLFNNMLGTYIATKNYKFLNIRLFSNISNKYISNLAYSLFELDPTNDELSEQLRAVGSSLKEFYGDKWDHLYKNFSYQYDLGKNYDVTETRTLEHKGNVTGIDTQVDQDSESSKSNVTKNETEGSIYGFNSTAAKPTDASNNTSSGDSITSFNRQHDITTNTDDTVNDTETTHTIGDMSVRAIQDQIGLDIALWQKYNFYDIIIADCVKFLTLDSY